MARILVVDDAKFMRKLYEAILEDEPHELVATASNGTEGVDAYEEHDPDVVIMNIRMPILDGIEATDEITDRDPDATVVICSGNQQEEKMKAAIRAGASDYVTKPFQREGLLTAIQNAVDDEGELSAITTTETESAVDEEAVETETEPSVNEGTTDDE